MTSDIPLRSEVEEMFRRKPARERERKMASVHQHEWLYGADEQGAYRKCPHCLRFQREGISLYPGLHAARQGASAETEQLLTIIDGQYQQLAEARALLEAAYEVIESEWGAGEYHRPPYGTLEKLHAFLASHPQA